MNEKFYVYLLRCSDNSLYCGYTNDIDKRLKTHNAKLGAKYTRGRTPVKLVYYELYPDKGSALSRERAIKKLSRSQKINLLKNFMDIENLL